MDEVPAPVARTDLRIPVPVKDRQFSKLPAPRHGTVGMAVIFSLGEAVDSFASLDKKIDAYKKDNCVELWKRAARTIKAAKKRVEKYLKPELKYYELKYCCIHEGQAFKTKEKGVRLTSKLTN